MWLRLLYILRQWFCRWFVVDCCGFYVCSMVCYALLCVFSSFAFTLMGKEKNIFFTLSSWCLVIVIRLFLTVSWVGLQWLWYFLIIFTCFFQLSIMKSFLSLIKFGMVVLLQILVWIDVGVCYEYVGKENWRKSKSIIYWSFHGGASFADLFCYLCFVFVMLSCRLFIADMWSPAWKGLTFWLSCIWCFIVFLSIFHEVS